MVSLGYPAQAKLALVAKGASSAKFSLYFRENQTEFS
jgi:hypothetical protein